MLGRAGSCVLRELNAIADLRPEHVAAEWEKVERNNFASTPVQVSPRQFDVLRVIHAHVEEYGYAPSIREIAERIGISAHAGVAQHLHALKRKGMVTLGGRARACALTESGLRAVRKRRPKPPKRSTQTVTLGRLGPAWVRGKIYFIEAVGCGRIKVGFTKGDPAERCRSLQTGCPFPLRVIAVFRGSQRGESELHRQWAALRVAGNVEWFVDDPTIRSFIAEHKKSRR